MRDVSQYESPARLFGAVEEELLAWHDSETKLFEGWSAQVDEVTMS